MVRKIFTALLTVCLAFVFFAACSKNEVPDSDGLIHVESVHFDTESPVSLQVGESASLSYTVLPANAVTVAARLTSSDSAVVSVNGNTVTAESVGSAVITVKTVDGAKTDTIQVNVEETVVLDSNKYTAEIVPERDARIDFHAENSVSYGDSASVTVKQNGVVKGSYNATVDYGNYVSCSLTDIGITEAGKYDFEVAFPGNPKAALDAVYVSDVEQRFYVTQAEGWSASAAPETGGWESADQHGTLKEDRVIVATGADTYGAIGLNVTLNNEKAPFIRFRVKALDKAVWAAKILATVSVGGKTVYVGADSRIVEEVSETDVTIDLRELSVKIISSPTSLTGTGEFLTLGDIEGDYQVTLQLFVVGTNGARDGSVTMDSIEIFRESGARTVAVRTDKYIEIESATAKNVNVDVGETVNVVPSLVGTNGAAPSFTDVVYVSQNENIATVSFGGVVKGVGGGETTVEIRRYDGLKLGEFTVTVRVPVQSLSFTTLSAELTPQGTLALADRLRVSPEQATNKKVLFSSGNTGVATVDENGVVTAVGIGTTKITVTSDDDASKTAEIKVIVSDAIVPVESIAISQTSAELQTGVKLNLSATITPGQATNDTIVWSTSNAAVATVSEDGEVTATGAGSATITATADGTQISASCEITVKEKQFTYEAVSDAFADDLIYIAFNGVQDGDTALLTFMKDGAGYTATATIGAGKAAVYVADIADFEAGVYTVSVSVLRGDASVAGFTYTGVTKYDVVFRIDTAEGWAHDWGGTVTQEGNSFSATGDMAAIKLSQQFENADYKLVVHSEAFEALGGSAMYAFKFTPEGGGEVAVGGDLANTYAEVIDLTQKGFTEGSMNFSVIVQNAKVTFGTLSIVTGEMQLK